MRKILMYTLMWAGLVCASLAAMMMVGVLGMPSFKWFVVLFFGGIGTSMTGFGVQESLEPVYSRYQKRNRAMRIRSCIYAVIGCIAMIVVAMTAL